jgi:hypothetical protein
VILLFPRRGYIEQHKRRRRRRRRSSFISENVDIFLIVEMGENRDKEKAQCNIICRHLAQLYEVCSNFKLWDELLLALCATIGTVREFEFWLSIVCRRLCKKRSFHSKMLQTSRRANSYSIKLVPLNHPDRCQIRNYSFSKNLSARLSFGPVISQRMGKSCGFNSMAWLTVADPQGFLHERCWRMVILDVYNN